MDIIYSEEAEHARGYEIPDDQGHPDRKRSIYTSWGSTKITGTEDLGMRRYASDLVSGPKIHIFEL